MHCPMALRATGTPANWLQSLLATSRVLWHRRPDVATPSRILETRKCLLQTHRYYLGTMAFISITFPESSSVQRRTNTPPISHTAAPPPLHHTIVQCQVTTSNSSVKCQVTRLIVLSNS